MFGLRGKRGRNSIAASFRTTEFQTQQEDLQMSSPPPGSSSSDAAMAAVTARITLVLDPAFFWAQVGRDEDLEDFDNKMAAVSKYCNDYATEAVSMPQINELISVKGVEPGEWVRAKVSQQMPEKSMIEVFYVDTGKSGRVDLSDVAAYPAPHLYDAPCQALQCSLYKAQPVDGQNWSKSAIERFSGLTTGRTLRARVMNSDSVGLTLSLYLRVGDGWHDVLELLVAEGQAIGEVDGDGPENGGDNTDPEVLVDEEKGEERDEEEEEGSEEEVEEVTAPAENKGPLVMKVPLSKEEEEEEKDGETATDDTTPAASDNEWDDSLLESSRDDLFSVDPFALPKPDSHKTPKYPLTSWDTNGRRGRGDWRGERRGKGRGWRGVRRRWDEPVGRNGGRNGSGCGEWRWREQPVGRGDGGEYSRGRGGWRRRGSGRLPGGIRPGREERGYGDESQPPFSNTRPQHQSLPATDNSRESLANSPQKLSLSQQEGEEKIPVNKESPAPSSTQPVELFQTGGVVRRESHTSQTGRGMAGAEVVENMSELRQLSKDVASKELNWHYWKLSNQIDKILEGLDCVKAEHFGNEVQTLLSSHSSVQKLLSLPGSRGPIWPVLTTLLSEGSKRKNEDEQKTVVVALRCLAIVLTVDVCQLLLPAVEALAEDVCRPSFSEQSVQTKKIFCKFVGKVFIDAGYSTNTEYARATGKVVRCLLNNWSSYDREESELQVLAAVECFGHLCRQIGPTIDVTNREMLERYFTDIVNKNILNCSLPESVRCGLLHLALERAAGWRNEKEEIAANSHRVVEPLPVHPARQQDTNGRRDTISVDPVTDVTISSHIATNGRQMVPPSLPMTSVHLPSSAPHLSSPSHSQSSELSQHNALNPPTGIIHQIKNPFFNVEIMLNHLDLCHLTDCFKNAKITDKVLEVGNVEFLRAGLRDAGLHPGEVVTILDYLERTTNQRMVNISRSLPTTPLTSQSHPSLCRHTSLPMSLSDDGHQIPPHSYHLQEESHPHRVSHHLPSPPVGLTPPPAPQPSVIHQPSTPLHGRQLSTPTLPPQTVPDHNLSTPEPQLFSPHQTPPPPQHDPQQYVHSYYDDGSHPPTPYPSSSFRGKVSKPRPHSLSRSSAPVYSSVDSPPPLSPPVSSGTSTNNTKVTKWTPAPARKAGFGQYSCVLCLSKEHPTPMCPNRHALLLQSNSLY